MNSAERRNERQNAERATPEWKARWAAEHSTTVEEYIAADHNPAEFNPSLKAPDHFLTPRMTRKAKVSTVVYEEQFKSS